jgi:uncharacterized membrane protein
MRCHRWVRAAGVATLVHVGAVVAQGPVAPALPPDPPPLQSQTAPPLGTPAPTTPLAPLGTPAPTTPPAPADPATPVAPPPITAPPPQFVATTPPATPAAVAAAAVTTTAALSVKQTLPETVVPGQSVAVEVSVTNTGGKAAENVVLAGWWTAGYEVAESSVAAQAGNGRQTWNMGAIPAGEARAVKLKLLPKAGTTATEFRSGFDATFSSATDTRAVKVLKPELQVGVEGSDTAFAGQAHTLHLKVKNPAGVAVERVAVKVELPEGLAHPKGSGLESEIPVLAAGTTEAIPLHLTAVKPGVGRVKVKVSAPGCDALTHDVQVNVIEARVNVSVSGPKQLYQGWPATFEATVENNGDQAIKGAAFDVKLPAGLTDLRASDKPGLDATANRLVWKFDLAAGEKKTVFWFGFAKQADDLTTAAAVSVGGTPLKRAEHVTKNLGTEGK